MTINNIHTTEIESAYAAIGGVWTGNGAITINGGVITVVSDACHAAAIGGGRTGAGNVTINGGTVSASIESENHLSYGAAIGGGGTAGGTILIGSGIVSANTDGYGAGIGAGKNGSADITLGWTKTDDSYSANSYSGSNFSIVSGTIVVAAGAAATIYVDGPAEEGTGVILGSEASVLIDAEEIDVQPEDANSECIEKTETENGTKYKNLKFAWVRIDTGITIMDAASDILPDCVNDIWDTYNQNTSSIVSILLPPVLDILSYTDIKIAFPYPKGWFFPPIPYLPNEMNPGNRFVAFFEDASASSYGTPFIGKIVEDELEIGALWLPQEAAIVSSDGSLTYYDLFTEAASASNGRIIKILKAPLVSYELKRTGSDPAVELLCYGCCRI